MLFDLEDGVEDFVGSFGYFIVRLIMDSSKSGPKTEGCVG